MTLERMKQTLAAALPQRLAIVMAGYDRFTAHPPPEDAKGFTAHHAAAKAALSHLDLLVKLVCWCHDETNASDGTAALLAQARQALCLIEYSDPEFEEKSSP